MNEWLVAGPGNASCSGMERRTFATLRFLDWLHPQPLHGATLNLWIPALTAAFAINNSIVSL